MNRGDAWGYFRSPVADGRCVVPGSRTSTLRSPAPLAPYPSRRGRHDGARAGRVEVVAVGIEIVLAEHVVQVHAGAGNDDPGARAVRAGDAGAAAVRVEHREVRRRAEPPAHLVGDRRDLARVEEPLGEP